MKVRSLKRIAADLSLGVAVASQVGLSRAASRLARGGAVASLFASGLAMAQSNGIITGIQNATTTLKAIISFITILGVATGLGFVFSAAMDLYRKEKGGRDEITWGSISTKVLAGVVSMALTYFAVQLVATLGGSQADIGRTLGN